MATVEQKGGGGGGKRKEFNAIQRKNLTIVILPTYAYVQKGRFFIDLEFISQYRREREEKKGNWISHAILY